MERKKLFRSVGDNIIAGVCGGLAEYFQVDSSLIRIIFILLTLCGGGGILIYLILWLVIPKESGEEKIIDRKKKVKEFAGEVRDKAKSMAKEIKIETRTKRTKRINIFGVILILVGLTALWNQVFPKLIDWDMFWPIILIVVGVLLIFRD
jgi:phage shock protein PspC (stress-responsive transcriptional regulator)